MFHIEIESMRAYHFGHIQRSSWSRLNINMYIFNFHSHKIWINEQFWLSIKRSAHLSVSPFSMNYSNFDLNVCFRFFFFLLFLFVNFEKWIYIIYSNWFLQTSDEVTSQRIIVDSYFTIVCILHTRALRTHHTNVTFMDFCTFSKKKRIFCCFSVCKTMLTTKH